MNCNIEILSFSFLKVILLFIGTWNILTCEVKRSAYFHGLHTHQQIISWKVLNDSDFELNVEDWDGCY